MSLAIRITLSALELEEKKFFDYIADRAELVCAVEHPKDDGCTKTHCHVYVQGCTVKYDAINNKLTSLGVPKGNEGRSIKQTYGGVELKPIDLGFITYMSKGKYKANYTKGLSAEEYEALKARWEERGKEVVKPPGQSKKTQKTDFEIYQEVYNYLEGLKYQCTCYLCSPHYQKGTISYDPDYKVLWDTNDSHRHIEEAIKAIRDIRFKYKKMTNQRTMESYLYQLINHRDINEFSVTRLKKFLFS